MRFGGVTYGDIEQAWRNVIEKNGYRKGSQLVMHRPKLSLGDDYGMEISESFRVTETGCEIFADVSRQLYIK